MPFISCLRSLLVFMLLSTLGCSSVHVGVRQVQDSSHTLLDVLKFPQNLTLYAEGAGPDTRLLSAAEQAKRNTHFDARFFAPWDQKKSGYTVKTALGPLRGKGAQKPRGYAENLLPWTQQRWASLADNAHEAAFPNRSEKAITVKPTPLREVPSFAPRFAHPSDPGQGFPFDLFAYATLPMGMPLYIAHASKDEQWLFVESAFVAGWVPADHVAYANDTFRKTYRTGRYGAIVREAVSINIPSGAQSANIGTILPFAEATPVEASGVSPSVAFTILVPIRLENGMAMGHKVRLSAQDVVQKPMPLTPANVAKVGNFMMGQPYGWGGVFGNRDCSMLMRDLFAPFGLWLPRNSTGQSKAWTFTPLVGTASYKEETILRQARPFATLLWMPGHIGLYLGQYNNQPVMLHAIWGLRTQPEYEDGPQGRFIIGRTVVTSTRPGVEIPYVKQGTAIIERLRGMSVLAGG